MKTTFQSIDISKVANRGFRDDATGHGGWTNQGEDDLRGMQSGPLKAGKLEFHILDPVSNGNKAVAAMRKGDPACGKGEDPLELHCTDATIKINCDHQIGKIRRLHGTNCAAPIYYAAYPATDISEDLRALDIPLTRLHDAPLFDHGMRLVDIDRVFPLFYLNEKDPRNYFFAHTDDYIANCLNYGSKVLYRLGPSIEHSKKSYFTMPPLDYDKWGEICGQIIAHYNEGWAGGFHHNIEYWEIWNEPDLGPKMWAGTWAEYLKLYVATAKRLKARFPNIKIGGPALTSNNEEKIRELLSECRTQGAPLDFFSWHGYLSNPADAIASPAIVKALLDECGFEKTELHYNEWHYFPGSWSMTKNSRTYLASYDKVLTGSDSAAFNCAVLSGLQDTPITMANYYTGSVTPGFSWGIFDSISILPNKNYFSLMAFNLMTKYETRLEADVPNGRNLWALAGRDSAGGIAVLVSCFKTSERHIHLDFGGIKIDGLKVKVSLLDSDNDLTPVKPAKISGGTITLEKPAGSAVFLVEVQS